MLLSFDSTLLGRALFYSQAVFVWDITHFYKMKNIVELECDIELEYVIDYHNLLLFRSENVLQFDILPSFPEKLSRLPVTLCMLFILSTLDSKCSRKNFCGYE